jgi:hypothetical protein
MTDAATPTSKYVFPRWANYALPAIAVMAAGGMFYLPVAVGLGFSPKTTAVGYAPDQPVPYSHALHVGKLGLDCRYCHNTVESTPFASLPPTQTCINCHANIKTESPALKPIRESWATGKPVQWTKIHDLPDYAYFNHSAHVNRGVGCVSCHGRIDQMDVVMQVQPLSMGWCLDCHRQPERHLRPKDQVTNMAWLPEVKSGESPHDAQLRVGNELKAKYGIRDASYMTSCYTCHR